MGKVLTPICYYGNRLSGRVCNNSWVRNEKSIDNIVTLLFEWKISYSKTGRNQMIRCHFMFLQFKIHSSKLNQFKSRIGTLFLKTSPVHPTSRAQCFHPWSCAVVRRHVLLAGNDDPARDILGRKLMSCHQKARAGSTSSPSGWLPVKQSIQSRLNSIIKLLTLYRAR